jgi:hypothetical protein
VIDAEQKKYDQKRTKRLNDLDIDEVMNNISGIYEDLKIKIANLKQPPQSPLSGGSH